MRRGLVATLVVVLMTTVVSAAPGRASTASSASVTSAAYAALAHTVTNLKRVLHGLDKLGKNECLRKRALAQATKIADAGELSHQDLDKVQSRCHMGWVGENVAYGYPSGKATVKAWMRSPGHRANILSNHYRLMGIAAVKRDGVWWVAQVFGTRQ